MRMNRAGVDWSACKKIPLAVWIAILFVMFPVKAFCMSTEPEGNVTSADLESITFHSKVFQASPVTFAHGEFRLLAVPQSASEVVVKLTDERAFGTLHGKSAAAIVMVTTLGGTGTFFELALLIASVQGWINTDTVLLGDRVQVRTVTIEDDHIAVAMMTHGPQDPLCCPTMEVMKRFAVKNDRLIVLSETICQPQSHLIGTVWQWLGTRYNNDTQTVPVKPADYTLQFLSEGKLVIKANCNLTGGHYSITNQQLSMLITHATLVPCEAESLENRFVQDLMHAAIFFFRDGYLYLDLKYDSGTMRFLPQQQE